MLDPVDWRFQMNQACVTDKERHKGWQPQGRRVVFRRLGRIHVAYDGEHASGENQRELRGYAAVDKGGKNSQFQRLAIAPCLLVRQKQVICFGRVVPEQALGDGDGARIAVHKAKRRCDCKRSDAALTRRVANNVCAVFEQGRPVIWLEAQQVHGLWRTQRCVQDAHDRKMQGRVGRMLSTGEKRWGEGGGGGAGGG